MASSSSQNRKMPHQSTEKCHDHQILLQSDEFLMFQQIQATHTPDGREIDSQHLLQMVHKSLFPDSQQYVDTSKPQEMKDELGISAYTIQRIYYEILCKCFENKDEHVTTMSIFTILSGYPWDVKLLLALLALGMNFGEFGLLTSSAYSANSLAQDIARFKQLPMLSMSLKLRLLALDDFIQRSLLQVAYSFVEFRDLLPQSYSSLADDEDNIIIMDCTATAAYWTIRGVVACISEISYLASLSTDLKTTSDAEVMEFFGLAEKVLMVNERFRESITQTYKEPLEVYRTLLHLCDDHRPVDETKIMEQKLFKSSNKLLRLLFGKEYEPELINCSTRNKVGFDVLEGKSMLLLVSDLDIPDALVRYLNYLYKMLQMDSAFREYNCEIVWLPIAYDVLNTPNKTLQKKLEALESSMPWYVLHHRWFLKSRTIKKHGEIDHVKNPIVVAIDPKGNITCPNALHMLIIWYVETFPITPTREEELWGKETWGVALLMGGIDATTLNWILEGEHICLYGGVDMDWVRQFTAEKTYNKKDAEIPLKKVYVGNSSAPEKVSKIMEIIRKENLSHCFPDFFPNWVFWRRLWSMFISRKRLGKHEDKDEILANISRLRHLDQMGKGWAIMCKDLTCEFLDEWEYDKVFWCPTTKLRRSLSVAGIEEIHDSDKSAKFEEEDLVTSTGDHVHIPSEDFAEGVPVVCTVCGLPMQKIVMYSCNIDED